MTSQPHQSIDEFRPDWTSPPGETISDLLEERDWNQSSFAERMGYTEKHISLLINGRAPLTEETAFKLEKVTEIPAGFWLMREVHFR